MAKKNASFNASASSNALINPPSLPHGAAAFDKIKTADLMPAIDWALNKLLEEIEAIKTNEDLPTFENTIEALEHAGADYGRVSAVFHTLSSVNTNDEIRELEKEVDKKTTPIFSDIAMDDVLFERIKTVYDAKDTLNLDAEQQRLLENAYEGRVRSGALLEPEKKNRLKEISLELAAKTTQFAQNTVKSTASYERIATKEELAGVPERALKSYKAAANSAIEAAEKEVIKAQGALESVQGMDENNFKSKKAYKAELEKAETALKDSAKAYQDRKTALDGNYLIGMQPAPMEILSHCENRDLRKEISDAMDVIACQGDFDNRGLVMEIVKLRHEKAQLLGYQNHADFILSDRMAGSVDAVQEFLEKNLNAYKPKAEAYFNEVKTYAELVKPGIDFDAHDFGFYSRKLKEERFSFDSEVLRPYFEVGNVLDGFRSHVENLFNVEMVDCTGDYPVYRDDAQIFEVKDKDSGEVKALFYADYFADAKAKRGGAWMNPFRDRAMDKHGNNQIPIVTNSCNYQKPTEDQPSLLSFREVETLFHEGGHAFHGILAEGKYASLNGTNVKWDFVELPSQLMENWLGEPEVLKSFAKHYETGEAIPDEYIAKLKETSNYGSAYMGLGQTRYGMLDMMWHTTDPSDIESPEALEAVITAKTSFFPPPEEGSRSASFGHLFSSPGGYSAGYYSYKWAEVLEADVYEEFKRNGLYDPETAQRLKETIFSQGGKIDPMELFKNMMGREPNPNALFRREGLIANDNDASAPVVDASVDYDAPQIMP